MANLESIVRELKSERDRLDKAIQALSSLNGTSSKTTTRPQFDGRKMSAAARARISAAQKARWAKSIGLHKATPKRHISAAGLARIRAAQRARWAKVRAGKK